MLPRQIEGNAFSCAGGMRVRLSGNLAMPHLVTIKLVQHVVLVLEALVKDRDSDDVFGNPLNKDMKVSEKTRTLSLSVFALAEKEVGDVTLFQKMREQLGENCEVTTSSLSDL